MISFRAGVFTGMTMGAAFVTTCLWNRPYYGLFSGMIQSVVTIGIRELFGKKASELYIAGVVIFSVGVIGREILKFRKKNTPKDPAHQEFKELHPETQPKNGSNVSSKNRSIEQTGPLASSSQALLFEEAKKFSCQIAQSTGRAIAEGFYITPSGKKTFLRSGAQLLEGSRSVPHSVLNFSMESRYENSEIVVIEQDCLYSAEMELKNGAKKVAVLMLASPIEPGGAMEEGNNGQEEELCRRSDIFGFMWDQARGLAESHLYNLVDLEPANEEDPQYSLKINNRMIHVPQVTVFRAGKDDDYKMLKEPFQVGMLVSPGLRCPKCLEINGKMCYQRAEDEAQLVKVLSTQLKVAYDENYDTVILGAFGCGAFSNPPELVAEFYKKIIETYFKGAFKKIIFPILDNGIAGKHNPEGNLKPFRKCFEVGYL